VYQDAIFNIAKHHYNTQQLAVWAAGAKNIHKWETKIKNQHFLLYKTYNQIAGFASLENLNHIDLMFVHSKFQGQGIAQILYDQLETIALNNHTVDLTVDASYDAFHFFLKNGFQEIKKQTLTLQSVEIENIKMVKSLP